MAKLCRLCGEEHWWYGNGDSNQCQRARDEFRSKVISRNHINGVYCKEWQQCVKCCKIKHWFRVLRHFSGQVCNPRKCPVCKIKLDSNQIGHYTATENRYKNNMTYIVLILYYYYMPGCENKRFKDWI